MTADVVDKFLFKCEGLPNFNQFTPQRIEKEFPVLLEKLNSDFNDIESEFASLIINENLLPEFISISFVLLLCIITLINFLV